MSVPTALVLRRVTGRGGAVATDPRAECGGAPAVVIATEAAMCF